MRRVGGRFGEASLTVQGCLSCGERGARLPDAQGICEGGCLVCQAQEGGWGLPGSAGLGPRAPVAYEHSRGAGGAVKGLLLPSPVALPGGALGTLLLTGLPGSWRSS